MSRLKHPDALVALALLALAVGFLWDVTVGGKALLPLDNLFAIPPYDALAAGLGITTPHNNLISDAVFQNISWKSFARESLLHGEIPLWNPYTFSGVPFLAAGQYAVLYPLGILFYLLPVVSAYGWFTALHLFLGALSMYIYLRTIGVVRFGALISALAFELCLVLVTSFLWPMVLSTAIWTPLLLALIELTVRDNAESTVARRSGGARPGPGYRSIIWPIAGAVVLGLQFLAGHMEYSFYVLFTIAYYSASRLIVAWWHVRQVMSVLRTALLLLAMVSLGAGLAAAQLFPFQEVIRENFRSGFSTYSDVIGWALPKMQVFSFVMPDFFGNPAQHTYFDFIDLKTKVIGNNFLGRPTDPPGTVFWGIKNYVEAASYVGILPLVLAIVAVFWRRNRYTWIFLGYGTFSLLLAFGTPLYAIFFFGIPGFDQLHTPFRWVYPYSMSIIVLAGIGAGALAENARAIGRNRSEGISRLSLLGLALLGLGSLILLGLLASRVAAGRSLAVANEILQRSDRLKEVFASGQMLYSYEFRSILIFGLLLAASGAVVMLSQVSPRRPWGPRPHPSPLWQQLAILLIIIDLFIAGYNFNSRTDPQLAQATPPSINFLKQDNSIFRVASFGPEDVLKPNLAMKSGFQDIRGYDTIILKQYVEFWRSFEEPYGLLYSMIKTLDRPSSLESPLLDLMNVKYVLSKQEVRAGGFKLVHDGDVRVYENTRVMPRAFLVDRVIAAQSREQALSELRSPAFDPRSQVVLEKWPSGRQLAGGPGELPVPTIRAYKANAVTLEVSSPRTALLVLSDSFFTGWEARVDGQEVDIYRADGAFRAIEVPSGAHVVEFKYSPVSFKIGLLGSFTGLAVVLCAGAMIFLGRLFRQPSRTSQRVARNSIAPMATQLLNKAVDAAFAMLMLRLLGPENIGKYTFAIIVVGYFEILTSFGLNTLLTREVAKDRSLGNRYLANTAIVRLLLTAGSAPIIAGLILFWQATNGLDAATVWAIVLLAVALVPANIAGALSSVFYAHERMEYPAAISLVTTLLKVTLGVVALLAGWGFVGLAAVSILVNLLTALIFGFLVRGVLFKPRLELDWKLSRGMMGVSLPLMINILLATLFFRIDIVLLQWIKGPVIVGFYATAYKFIDGLSIIPTSFTVALFPVLSRYADSSRESFVRAYILAVRLLLMVGVPIAVGTFFLAEPIVLLFGGRQYLPHSVIALQAVILFLPFSYLNSVTQYVLIALNQQRFITLSFVIAAAFNISGNLILIPRYSYVGAAIITILSEIVLLTPFLYCLHRHIGSLPLLSIAARPIVASAIMATVLWLFQYANPFLLFLLGAFIYVGSLAALRTFTADDRALARRLLGREKPSTPVEAI
ncbi:MAG: oligosaccharide flippase family protein [Chloroflexi bacterium]|nr:oligosaccharide flippase family protein [Chloroflexota bacterium]